MALIERRQLKLELEEALVANPAVVLAGPRQCGKTTCARRVAAQQESVYFDLEDPRDLASLANPMTRLESLTGLVVIDEVQRRPEIFEILRVLLDRPHCPATFLLLGSASFHLLKSVSETLAGRVGLIDMGGFSLDEIGADHYRQLWERGGFPRSYLAAQEKASSKWRHDFTRTFLERDVPQLGISIPTETLRRFWTMVAHYHGQVWNAAEFARSLGRGEKAARRYLDILTGAYMVRQLQPWHENLKKRQVKSPKVYIRDSGILHTLLSLDSMQALQGHPKLGASWEGFCIEQVLAQLRIDGQAWFWATHAGAELDLLLFYQGKRIGFEMKYADAPKMTKSLQIALQDLHLDFAFILYPGDKAYDLERGVRVLPVTECHTIASRLVL